MSIAYNTSWTRESKKIRPCDEDETPFSRLRRLLEDEENARNKSLKGKVIFRLIHLSLSKDAGRRVGPSAGQPYHGTVTQGSHMTQESETGERMGPGAMTLRRTITAWLFRHLVASVALSPLLTLRNPWNECNRSLRLQSTSHLPERSSQFPNRLLRNLPNHRQWTLYPSVDAATYGLHRNVLPGNDDM